jgi:hypothetical protein
MASSPAGSRCSWLASNAIDLLFPRGFYLLQNLSLLLMDFLRSPYEPGEACCSSEKECEGLTPSGDCRLILVTCLSHRPSAARSMDPL